MSDPSHVILVRRGRYRLSYGDARYKHNDNAKETSKKFPEECVNVNMHSLLLLCYPCSPSPISVPQNDEEEAEQFNLDNFER